MEDAVATETITAEEALAVHGAEAAGPGMPQLDVSSFPNQIFWLLVTLGVIYFVLSRFALPRIGAVLAERAGTITNDIAAAEELRHRAREAETAYDKALADARAEANRIVAETKAQIQADLDAEIERADAQIAAKTAESQVAIDEIRESAARNVSEVARDVAREIVAAFGADADAAKVDAAVDAKLGERA